MNGRWKGRGGKAALAPTCPDLSIPSVGVAGKPAAALDCDFRVRRGRAGCGPAAVTVRRGGGRPLLSPEAVLAVGLHSRHPPGPGPASAWPLQLYIPDPRQAPPPSPEPPWRRDGGGGGGGDNDCVARRRCWRPAALISPQLSVGNAWAAVAANSVHLPRSRLRAGDGFWCGRLTDGPGGAAGRWPSRWSGRADHTSAEINDVISY